MVCFSCFRRGLDQTAFLVGCKRDSFGMGATNQQVVTRIPESTAESSQSQNVHPQKLRSAAAVTRARFERIHDVRSVRRPLSIQGKQTSSLGLAIFDGKPAQLPSAYVVATNLLPPVYLASSQRLLVLRRRGRLLLIILVRSLLTRRRHFDAYIMLAFVAGAPMLYCYGMFLFYGA